MLETQEVLPRGSISGNSGSELVLVPSAPGVLGEVAALVADSRLANLEPVAGAIVALDIITRGFRHVIQGRA